MRQSRARTYCILAALALITAQMVVIHHEGQIPTAIALLSAHLSASVALQKVHNVPKFIMMGHVAAFVNYLGVQQEVVKFAHSFIGGIPLWLPFAWANACALARYL